MLYIGNKIAHMLTNGTGVSGYVYTANANKRIKCIWYSLESTAAAVAGVRDTFAFPLDSSIWICVALSRHWVIFHWSGLVNRSSLWLLYCEWVKADAVLNEPVPLRYEFILFMRSNNILASWTNQDLVSVRLFFSEIFLYWNNIFSLNYWKTKLSLFSPRKLS